MSKDIDFAKTDFMASSEKREKTTKALCVLLSKKGFDIDMLANEYDSLREKERQESSEAYEQRKKKIEENRKLFYIEACKILPSMLNVSVRGHHNAEASSTWKCPNIITEAKLKKQDTGGLSDVEEIETACTGLVNHWDGIWKSHIESRCDKLKFSREALGKFVEDFLKSHVESGVRCNSCKKVYIVKYSPRLSI